MTASTRRSQATPTGTISLPLPSRFLRCIACGTVKKERSYALCAECWRVNGTLLVLAWRNAGWIGLDRWLLPAVGTPWQPGGVFRDRSGSTDT